MDIAEDHRNLVDPAWRRWLLLGALVLLGVFYVVACSFFFKHSVDFIAARYNQRALEYSRAHVVPLPAKLSFGLGEADNARLGSGWHRPDTGGVWTESVDAFVEIAVSRQHPALLLRLNTTVFLPKHRPRMKIKAVINGVAAGKWERRWSNASEPLEIVIPAALFQADHLALHLKLDHIASPFRLRNGPDTRELGLLLWSIEVGEAPGTASTPTPR
jgi:hypothetical protein